MIKVLIVVDMQNDFVDGALGTPEAKAIVPNVVKKIGEYNKYRDLIFVTKDTHDENYMETLEGKKLPVPHCIRGRRGWNLNEKVEEILYEIPYFGLTKSTFGSFELISDIFDFLDKDEKEEYITFEVVGLCTDICVVSNALLLRSAFQNSKIIVDASCCAGTTPENHKAALTVMKCCQIDVINE